MEPSIDIDDLTVSYHRHPAVHHLSGTFAGGSLNAIVGPNGAGKSTLLKAIMGLLRVDSGRIGLSGQRRDQIAYLPQLAEIDRSFPISVLDVVLLGDWRRSGAFGAVTPYARRAAERALEEVGLVGFAGRSIGSLSAGQLQRVQFARIVVQDGPIVLLDEPFAAIDAPTIADLMTLVTGWHHQGRTVVAVLHDLAMVRDRFPQTLLLARSSVAWGPTERVLSRENLLRAWGMPQGWDADAAACVAEAAAA